MARALPSVVVTCDWPGRLVVGRGWERSTLSAVHAVLAGGIPGTPRHNACNQNTLFVLCSNPPSCGSRQHARSDTRPSLGFTALVVSIKVETGVAHQEDSGKIELELVPIWT
ncbi:hypothetical protein RRG08_066646 [Elysia crispata]|uniref:Uncharacterized protein n=1 Tax=Elysia crispata TaxID=231223 RepID=A0AAE1DIB2_9GAST|nr:hypothetical protein RRG08_066646 [Elysia crispata]